MCWESANSFFITIENSTCKQIKIFPLPTKSGKVYIVQFCPNEGHQSFMKQSVSSENDEYFIHELEASLVAGNYIRIGSWWYKNTQPPPAANGNDHLRRAMGI
jgi:hypothetical protein